MNNKLICPFCQQELEEDYLDVQLFGCENQNCKHWINNDIIGSKELWQELIRTRKALDVAVDALKEIIDWDKCVALQSNDFVGIANKALEQITALEQKDK